MWTTIMNVINNTNLTMPPGLLASNSKIIKVKDDMIVTPLVLTGR